MRYLLIIIMYGLGIWRDECTSFRGLIIETRTHTHKHTHVLLSQSRESTGLRAGHGFWKPTILPLLQVHCMPLNKVLSLSAEFLTFAMGSGSKPAHRVVVREKGKKVHTTYKVIQCVMRKPDKKQHRTFSPVSASHTLKNAFFLSHSIPYFPLHPPPCPQQHCLMKSSHDITLFSRYGPFFPLFQEASQCDFLPSSAGCPHKYCHIHTPWSPLPVPSGSQAWSLKKTKVGKERIQGLALAEKSSRKLAWQHVIG